jgi:zinc/manganese transport system substrate-binding protein
MARRLIALVAAALFVAACGTTQPTASGSGKVRVVAAENFWGSIAGQIGADRASVTSVIANPNTDPHDYEPTPSDARTMATAQYVIVNGAGYDAWAQKLLDANPVSGRKVLVVADLVGKKEGDNPHLWYSPAYVKRFIDRVASDLGALDASDAGYFTQQAAQYETTGLKGYFDTITAIKQKYAGTKVGATESIFSYLADALGLDLITPYSFLNAISEGSDPSAADKAEVEREITSREIRVFVFNSQNATPDIQGLVAQAKAAGIPVVKMTETLSPQNESFQGWQTGQLEALQTALGG